MAQYPAPTTGTHVSAVVSLSPTSTATGVGQLKYALGASDAPGAGIDYLALPSTPMNAANTPRVFQLTMTTATSSNYSSSVNLTGVVLDVLGNLQTPATTINAVWKAYCQTSAINAVASPFCFNQSIPSVDYRGSGEPVTVTGSGTNNLTGALVAKHVGRAIVELQFPSFANTEGTSSGSGDPLDMIYVQVQVIVVKS